MKKVSETGKNRRKAAAVCVMSVMSVGWLGGCGQTPGGVAEAAVGGAPVGSTTAGSTTAESGTAEGVTKVRFASGTINWPFCYLDENGNPDGFEFAVAREVDKLLDQYEFEYIGAEWEDMFTSVQLGKIDIAAWTIKKTPEREQEFLFADEWSTVQKFYLTVGGNNDTIHDLADLQDVTVDGNSPDEYIYKFWENYNADHPEQNIQLIASGDILGDAGIEALQNGATAAIFMDDITVAGHIEKRGPVLKTVGEPLAEEYGYYVYNKSNTELKEAVDGALRELKENGTYDRLYEEWFSFVDEALQK